MSGGLSNSQVDKAGAVLREWLHSDRSASAGFSSVERRAIAVVWEYRAAFSRPLIKVNVNLRHYIKKAGCEVVVAQRLKRLPRIAVKLIKQPRMRLSQMQDVGGCRAVLPNQEAVYSVLEGIRRNWDIITVDDYAEHPKPTGYRAIHPIVRRDERAIEVQLRTVGQQDWADEVERIDSRASYAAKDGDGPPEVRRYLQLLADAIAQSEAGTRISVDDLRELSELRTHVP